jgi:hypothetical protein
MPEYSSTPQRRRRKLGCNLDVCNETVAKKALTCGSFSGLRPGLTGKRFYHKKIVGTVEQYPDEDAARRAVVGFVSELNADGRPTNSTHFRHSCVTQADISVGRFPIARTAMRQRSRPIVHRLASLLHASFRPRLAASVISPLRFANPSPPSGWVEDLHLQAVEHARHTKKGAKRALFAPSMVSMKSA